MLLETRESGNLDCGGNYASRGRIINVMADKIISNGILLLEWDYARNDTDPIISSSIIYSRLHYTYGNMTSGQTTIYMDSGNLDTGVLIQVDSEQILILNKTSTDKQYNCLRAQNSTTAASHVASTNCYQVGNFDLWKFKVYQNGVYKGDTTLEEFTINYRPGVSNRVELVPCAANDTTASSSLYTVQEVGKRVKITWTPSTDTDLSSQRIYYDEGNGLRSFGDFVILADSLGPERTKYETDSLDDNIAYRFLIAEVDIYGNERKGGIFAKTTNAEPDGASNLSLEYGGA